MSQPGDFNEGDTFIGSATWDSVGYYLPCIWTYSQSQAYPINRSFCVFGGVPPTARPSRHAKNPKCGAKMAWCDHRARSKILNVAYKNALARSLRKVEMGSMWGQNGVEMGLKCGRNGAEMGSKWGRNGVKMGPKWGRNGAKMGLKRGQNGSLLLHCKMYE
jgi:hypothetical protein